MPHAGVEAGVFDQQVGYLGLVPATGIKFQCRAVILVELIVEGSPVPKGAALVAGVFLVQLPLQKPAEDGPESVIAQLFQVHHAGLAKQANQTLIGVGVPRDDPGQLRG